MPKEIHIENAAGFPMGDLTGSPSRVPHVVDRHDPAALVGDSQRGVVRRGQQLVAGPIQGLEPRGGYLDAAANASGRSSVVGDPLGGEPVLVAAGIQAEITASSGKGGQELTGQNSQNEPGNGESASLTGNSDGGGGEGNGGAGGAASAGEPDPDEPKIFIRDLRRSPRDAYRKLGRQEDIPDIVRSIMPDGAFYDVSRDSTYPPNGETYRHAEMTAHAIQQMLDHGVENIKVVDVGTGSGVFAGKVAQELQEQVTGDDAQVRVVGTDFASKALADAQGNFAANNIDGVALARADLLQGVLPESSDIIFSHPPFWEQTAYNEGQDLKPAQAAFYPKTAVHAGETGMEMYERLIKEAPAALSQRGVIILQHLDQDVEKILALIAPSFSNETTTVKKLSGRRQTALAIGYKEGLIDYFPGETIDIPDNGSPSS